MYIKGSTCTSHGDYCIEGAGYRGFCVKGSYGYGDYVVTTVRLIIYIHDLLFYTVCAVMEMKIKMSNTY